MPAPALNDPEDEEEPTSPHGSESALRPELDSVIRALQETLGRVSRQTVEGGDLAALGVDVQYEVELDLEPPEAKSLSEASARLRLAGSNASGRTVKLKLSGIMSLPQVPPRANPDE